MTIIQYTQSVPIYIYKCWKLSLYDEMEYICVNNCLVVSNNIIAKLLVDVQRWKEQSSLSIKNVSLKIYAHWYFCELKITRFVRKWKHHGGTVTLNSWHQCLAFLDFHHRWDKTCLRAAFCLYIYLPDSCIYTFSPPQKNKKNGTATFFMLRCVFTPRY